MRDKIKQRATENLIFFTYRPLAYSHIPILLRVNFLLFVCLFIYSFIQFPSRWIGCMVGATVCFFRSVFGRYCGCHFTLVRTHHTSHIRLSRLRAFFIRFRFFLLQTLTRKRTVAKSGRTRVEIIRFIIICSHSPFQLIKTMSSLYVT